MKLKKPAGDADQQAEIEADDRKPQAVPEPEKQTDQRLPAQKAGHRPVDLMRELMHDAAIARRNEAVDAAIMR